MGVFLPLFASSFEFPESFKLAMQFRDLVKFLNILLENLKSLLENNCTALQGMIFGVENRIDTGFIPYESP